MSSILHKILCEACGNPGTKKKPDVDNTIVNLNLSSSLALQISNFAFEMYNAHGVELIIHCIGNVHNQLEIPKEKDSCTCVDDVKLSIFKFPLMPCKLFVYSSPLFGRKEQHAQ